MTSIVNRRSLASLRGRRELIVKILLALRSFSVVGSLVTILSGCTAIGYSKPAALQVTSEPEASVFLDGKHLGKTPFYSDQFESGVYTLKISASDAKFVSSVQLTEGTLTVVNRQLAGNFIAQSGEVLSLKPSATGVIVTSWPNEADLTIDGRYIGKTPQLVTGIGHGDHKVLVSKQDYTSRQFAIKTSPKYQVVTEVTLASEIAEGAGKTAKEPTQGAE